MTTSRTDKYQHKDDISHALARPDMYIGTVRSKLTDEYIAIPYNNGYKIHQKEINVSPGFIRIFIEALSNAVDNVERSKGSKNKCTKIKVNINKETGETSVLNDGMSIPIEKKDGEYVHTMIFGKLRTGENYDDEQERTTSGRNGIGIKASNIYSKYFRVRGVDKDLGKKITQEWRNNMRDRSEAIIEKSKLNDCTEILYIPDFEKFGMTGYTDDIVYLFYKYVIDAAMLTGINVYLNGELVPYTNLIEYSKLYIKEKDEPEILTITTKTSEIVISPNNGYKHVSFVNGIYTMKGGKHVDAWSEELFRPLVDKFNKKGKPQITIKDIKQFFIIFVKVTVINPEFESQSKHQLESPNVEANVPPKYINMIMKWSVAEKIQDIIESKEILALKKTENKSRGFKKIEGYDRANNSSNSKLSNECTLILCEGDSAKQYAVWGIESGAYDKSGRDWFGIMPLRGKLLNVRNSTASTIANNNVISNITNALGLKYGIDYTDSKNFSTLKYGKLMLLTDSDCDGLHIAGLVINYIGKLFPSLLDRTEPFIVDMKTPIAKINTKPYHTLFYDEREYNEFMLNNQGKYKKDDYKYYKGLGSSNVKDVSETFGKKIIEYIKDDKMDETLNKVFLKTSTDIRKEWLENYDPQSYKKFYNTDIISKLDTSDFYDNFMIQFSIADCGRNIPNIMDGLKNSQRKILYSCFKRKLTTDIKVSQLAGYVSEHSNYHHGEASLYTTITHMASCFVGGNNVPLLAREGMMGSRLQGGKDAASPRYIFTKLEKITRCLFPEEDDILLKNVIDDGDFVEPEFYPCIIPLILANPCNGAIGTGWSSNIPAYNPLELCDSVEEWLKSDGDMLNYDGTYKYTKMKPWYRGFKGTIEEDENRKNRYISKGIIERDIKDKLIVTELPIGLWTDDFKEKLEDMLEAKTIAELKNYSTPVDVHFEIKEYPDGVKCSEDNLKLKEYIHISNLVAFTSEGKIRKFETIYEIIDEFCKIRFNYYILRKVNIIKEYTKILKTLTNKRRFIQEIIDDVLIIFKLDDEGVLQNIKDRNFDMDEKGGYDYLLSIQTRSYTQKKLEELDKEISKYECMMDNINKTTEKQLWKNDLDKFRKEYIKFLDVLQKEEDDMRTKKLKKIITKPSIKVQKKK